jgi:quinol monooxygenase YgiN
MHSIIWVYRVVEAHCAAFVDAYSADGAWAQLFRRSDDYIGTELLNDRRDPLRFITIDQWKSHGAFHQFKQRYQAEYDALDSACAEFTESEELIGGFATVQSHGQHKS